MVERHEKRKLDEKRQIKQQSLVLLLLIIIIIIFDDDDNDDDDDILNTGLTEGQKNTSEISHKPYVLKGQLVIYSFTE